MTRSPRASLCPLCRPSQNPPVASMQIELRISLPDGRDGPRRYFFKLMGSLLAERAQTKLRTVLFVEGVEEKAPFLFGDGISRDEIKHLANERHVSANVARSRGVLRHAFSSRQLRVLSGDSIHDQHRISSTGEGPQRLLIFTRACFGVGPNFSLFSLVDS